MMPEIKRKYIKVLMANRGFNVRSLAKASGMSEPGINRLINHDQKPRLDTLGKLAKALRVPASDLIKD